MKQVIFFILMFSVTLAFAQTEQSAASSTKEDEKTSTIAVKGKKVSEIRHVVIKGNVQMGTEVQEQKQTAQKQKQVKHDAKGGIVVPNASKGIKQKSLTPDQKKLLERVRKAETKKGRVD